MNWLAVLTPLAHVLGWIALGALTVAVALAVTMALIIVYWHTHFTVCYLVQEIRFLLAERPGSTLKDLAWWDIPRRFGVLWWHLWHESMSGNSCLRHEDLGSWHYPRNIFSMGHYSFRKSKTGDT